MPFGAEAKLTTELEPPAPDAPGGRSPIWPPLAILSLVLAGGAILARLWAGPRFDGVLMLAAGAVSLALVLRLVIRDPVPAASALPEPVDTLRAVFDSAGPAVVATDLQGKLTYVNPAAERLLGYHAADLQRDWLRFQVLGPGEGARLAAEMQKLCGIQRPPAPTPAARLVAFMECVRTLPPSRVPSFDTQLRRKDGSTLPITLHISALRDADGAIAGLVAVAVDQSSTMHQEQVQRESQERYRDLFENSREMIATLSPAGQFLYANPAWKLCFAKEPSELVELASFEELFSPENRSGVAALFRRALDGEAVDRASVRHLTEDGRVLELELTLSQRQKAGNPLAVRCLMRDVTQQKQREHRLGLQLMVSQIIGQNASPDAAAVRILEALCVWQGWDLALKWGVNTEEKRLEFRSAWGAPGHRAEALIQESMGWTLAAGSDLPGRVWHDGRPIWISDLAQMPPSPRIQAALRQEMVSGWAVPVRAGSKVLAVLEFYSHVRLREDREALAAIETVAASLGQMMASSQEHGRAEELFRQQEILLDTVTDGICGVDRRGRVTFANPAAARLLGAEAATLTARPVHHLLHGFAPASYKCGEDCPLRRAADRNRTAAGEETIFRADGASFPAEYVLTPIVEQGHFSGSVLSFRDISQRYALDRLKDEFISTVSHELRTPLTSIRGALGLLSSGILGQVSDKASNLLRIALTNSDRLVRLINDILDLERIQSGREPLAFRPVQLANIVRQALEGMQNVAETAGVQLIHDTTQVEIAADADRLLQVLTNLLSNAVKFSPPNSTISIMLRPGTNGVTLSVIDQGRGIPADKLETIFGRFQQVDASDSRQKGGSGLGLAICRTIVLQHAGRIWAERNPVRGSTFRVFLPYHPAPADVHEPELVREPGNGAILLADANVTTRPQIAKLLAGHGYRVLEAANVEDLLAAAHLGAKAILLETSPEGMSGFETLPLLRRMDPENHTPVVLFSIDGRPDGEDQPQIQSQIQFQVQPGLPFNGANGHAAKALQEDILWTEFTRVLCGPGENARVLVVESDRDLAAVIGDVFTHACVEVHLAHNLQEALDGSFAFQPHLLVLNIGLPNGDSFNMVDWLRQNENLARTPLVVYSARNLLASECRPLKLGPTEFLSKARLLPQQLEALVLTMMRNSAHSEETIRPESSLLHP